MLDENFGFTGVNIKGLKYTNNSEYIALLNNDTEPEKNWLEVMINTIWNMHLKAHSL